jgi:hypothetical protein
VKLFCELKLWKSILVTCRWTSDENWLSYFEFNWAVLSSCKSNRNVHNGWCLLSFLNYLLSSLSCSLTLLHYLSAHPVYWTSTWIIHWILLFTYHHLSLVSWNALNYSYFIFLFYLQLPSLFFHLCILILHCIIIWPFLRLFHNLFLYCFLLLSLFYPSY